MKNRNNYVDCPNCLGTGLEYDFDHDRERKCKICKGKGKVKEEFEESFTPLLFENLNCEDDE